MKKLCAFLACLCMLGGTLVTSNAAIPTTSLQKSARISGSGTSGIVSDTATYSQYGWSFNLIGYSGNATAGLNYVSVSTTSNPGNTTATRTYTVKFTNSSYNFVYGYGSNTWQYINGRLV